MVKNTKNINQLIKTKEYDMIKVRVYWASGMGEAKTYTLKEFQDLFNQAEYDVFDKIWGNKIEFIVE